MMAKSDSASPPPDPGAALASPVPEHGTGCTPPAHHTRRPDWTHAALLAIILLATLLRFYRLDEQSLWYDEGFSVALAKSSLAQAVAWTAQDVHPPLYYLLLHVWIALAGDSAWAVRTFSVLCGVAAVPLVYVLGKRAFNGATGLVAAALVVFSPLHLYYARETRMYALLTALSVLSSYLVLRLTAATDTAERDGALWELYCVTAVAMAYVHYFALLVLTAHAVYLVGWWMQEGRPLAMMRRGLAVVAVWLAAYLPWLPVALRRFLYDTGYWQGTMPPLHALRSILTSFAVWQALPEPLAWRVTVGHLFLVAGGGPLLVRALRARPRRLLQPVSFIWLYLWLPAVAIAFLYARKPKMTPRYSMLVSPAFLLLIAATVAMLWRRGARASQPRSGLRHWLEKALLLTGILAGAFLLGTAVRADQRIFFAPELRRADFRGAVGYVCQQASADEAIVLVAGHMFPIFDYYCPGHERYPIPDDPVLRVEHMVTLKVLDDLQRITASKSGVWLLLWQDDVIDPNRLVPNILLTQGDELPLPTSFHDVGLKHIRLRPEARFVWEESIVIPSGERWQRGIVLLEARLNRLEFRHGDTAQVTLFWRADAPIPESYTVFVHIQREEARTQHDGMPANNSRPTYTWRPGEVIEDRHMVEIPSWLPPGEYALMVGLYNPALPNAWRLSVLDEMGNEKNSFLTLASLRILGAEGQ